MLDVTEKNTAQLGGHKRVIARVRTREEGVKFLQSHVGDRKVPWLTYDIAEPSAEDEKLSMADLEMREKALDIAERELALAERQARLDMVKRMASGAVKSDIDAETAVRNFLEGGDPGKVGVVDAPKTDETK